MEEPYSSDAVDAQLVLIGHHEAPLWLAYAFREQWHEWRGGLELAGGDYLAIPADRADDSWYVAATMRPAARLGLIASRVAPYAAWIVMRALAHRHGCGGWQASEFWSLMAAKCRDG